jgi:hypothetical protein
MIFFAENHNYAIAQAWATGIICFSFAGRHSGMLQAGIKFAVWDFPGCRTRSGMTSLPC